MNMSYCRFRNTLEDLKDCYNALDEELSPEEHKARKKLLMLCQTLVQEALDMGATDDIETAADELPVEGE